jgi:chorismate synthase
MNTFGRIFRLTSFGESHGRAIGGVIDGCPPGVEIDLDYIQGELDRRRPGQSSLTTQRKEGDRVEFLSGIFEGKSLGTPIGFLVYNQDHRSGDYDALRDVFRPSHADYTWQQKYGTRDHRGGGRSSARETIARVVAGAIARLVLIKQGVQVQAYVSRIHGVEVPHSYKELDLSLTDRSLVRCPHPESSARMIALIEEAARHHDTVGGVITGVITGVPPGWGEPVFNKLHADLGFAMLGINAVKGFDYGSGFEGTRLYGSEHNDIFIPGEKGVRTLTNHSGGIQGGISNGEDICFRVAFKPVATLLREQSTVNTAYQPVTIHPEGRHDPCVLPRAVPIVEAMAALVLADHYLMQNLYI